MHVAARSVLRLAVLACLLAALCFPGNTAPTQAVAAVQPRSTQPLLGWLGVVDADRLIRRDAGGITLKKLSASGVAGYVVMLHEPPDSVPEAIERIFTKIRAHGLLYVGVYIANPLPDDWADFRRRLDVVASAAKRAGANGLAFDAEPYEYPDGEWESRSPTDRATMRANAESLAPIVKSVGNLLIYPSSTASFPGSYNDLIHIQNGDQGIYAKNLFPDFLDGLLAGGVDVTLTDASFHWGPQGSGDTWETGIEESVSRATKRFPGMKASVMLWPDNSEGHGAFSPDDVQDAVAAATRLSTGPVFLYQQSLATGSDVSAWKEWLAAIKAALRD
jgi:hypothetical protein